MKNNWIILSLIFIWCLFMGVTGISIGFGAIFPSVNRIAKPFVCPRGEMQLETQEYNPSPVETVKTLTWYCVDNTTGERVELGLFPMSLYAGLIYGFLLFLVVVGGYWISMKRISSGASPLQDITTRKAERARELAEQIHRTNLEFTNRGTKVNESQRAFNRMKELKDMRDANLISEAEYEQKRAEILKEM
ncbi:MAG TPA: SHOCT domain-containing protein [Anaerolineales bacterium]|nr:SHOCT domain-containing protein [Anaerolineales bacterium]HNQ95096.1 SHOCT domain-containing protein [Anaerolineales bacterium]HNS60770.1 SHOCT domain-containing protein [Anaerolineales bacterium]